MLGFISTLKNETTSRKNRQTRLTLQPSDIIVDLEGKEKTKVVGRCSRKLKGGNGSLLQLSNQVVCSFLDTSFVE